MEGTIEERLAEFMTAFDDPDHPEVRELVRQVFFAGALGALANLTIVGNWTAAVEAMMNEIQANGYDGFIQ